MLVENFFRIGYNTTTIQITKSREFPVDNKTKDAIKQIQAEMRHLQTLITARGTERAEEAQTADESNGQRKGKDTIVHCVVQYRVPGGSPEPKKMIIDASPAQIARVTNESGAALGYALASPQKIALLRALLDKDTESASVLGEATHLSTGSLYHHLRELMRAEMIHQTGRNQYQLTERGTRVLLTLLALAAE